MLNLLSRFTIFCPVDRQCLAKGKVTRGARPEQLVRGIHCRQCMFTCTRGAKKSRSTTSWPILECSLSTSAALTCSDTEPLRVNAVAMFSIAARFQVPICVASHTCFACVAGNSGPVALSCRPKCSFKPPCVRKRPGFSSLVMSVDGADCRSR